MNSSAWAIVDLPLAMAKPLAAWYQSYGQPMLTLLDEDENAIPLSTVKTLLVTPSEMATSGAQQVAAGCSQLGKDAQVDLTYHYSKQYTKIPPIPTPSLQADWLTALHDFATGGTTCAAALGHGDYPAFVAGFQKVAAGSVAFGKVYRAVTAQVVG